MGFFDFFNRKKSGSVAKDRLKLLLVSERADCSPEMMEMIKNDIIQVISKYMEIDTEGLDIQITNHGEDGGSDQTPALYANIPIRGRKHVEGAGSVPGPRMNTQQKSPSGNYGGSNSNKNRSKR